MLNEYSEYELHNVSQGLNADGSEQSKHDPYCDCGICAYCNGQEDVNGNPSVSALARHTDNGLRDYILFQIREGCYEQDRFKWRYLLDILEGRVTYPR